MSEELTMKDFEQELNRSFKKIFPGDVVTGTVIGISDTEVTLDLNYFSEGIIPLNELSNDPRFSIKADVTLGETISAVVTHENREGALMLSKKKADDLLSWDKLKELQEANQRDIEINPVKKQVDQNAEVWRYLANFAGMVKRSSRLEIFLSAVNVI